MGLGHIGLSSGVLSMDLGHFGPFLGVQGIDLGHFLAYFGGSWHGLGLFRLIWSCFGLLGGGGSRQKFGPSWAYFWGFWAWFWAQFRGFRAWIWAILARLSWPWPWVWAMSIPSESYLSNWLRSLVRGNAPVTNKHTVYLLHILKPESCDQLVTLQVFNTVLESFRRYVWSVIEMSK